MIIITEQIVINKIVKAFKSLGVPFSSISIPNLSEKIFELYSLTNIIEKLKRKKFILNFILINGNV